MKTIKKGRPQKGWSQELECTGSGNGGGGCHAKLLVEQDDVYRTESHARDEMTTYHTFKCQECGVETDIPDYVNIPFGTPTKAKWLERKGEQVTAYYNK